MTFLEPRWLAVAGAVAAGVVLLHVIARHFPPVATLPTARFIPAHRARAVSRTLRLSDLLLLVLRVALVLAAGAALARPVLEPRRRSVARVVVLDRSRAVASLGEGLDSARAIARAGDAIVVFDSAVRELDARALETLPRGGAGAGRGALSAALIVARRAAARLETGADTVELVVVSPLTRESWDRATPVLLERWPGLARSARIAMRRDSASGDGVTVRAERDDPIFVAAALLGTLRQDAAVRIVRGSPDAADSAWARDGDRALVVWPREPRALWPAREPADTVGAVVAGDVVLVTPLAREVQPPAARVVAHWVDGEAAATEQPLGRGCLRAVAVAVPAAGDVALRPDFGRVVASLSSRCGGPRAAAQIGESDASLYFTARARPARSTAGTSIAPWLLALALLLAIAEPFVRRQRAAAEATA